MPKVFPLFRRLPPAPKAGDQDFWAKHSAHINERYRRMGWGVALAVFGFTVSLINTIVAAVRTDW